MSDVAERTPEIAARAHDVSMLSELEVAEYDVVMRGMVELYGDHGVTPEDFSLLEVETTDGPRMVIAYSEQSGLDLGDDGHAREWNAIFAPENDAKFIIQDATRAIDTRLGMTKPVYEALVAEGRAVDYHIDTEPRDKTNYYGGRSWAYDWTYTSMTGERATATDHQAAIVGADGTIVYRWGGRQSDSEVMRFRPAVMLTSNSVAATRRFYASMDRAGEEMLAGIDAIAARFPEQLGRGLRDMYRGVDRSAAAFVTSRALPRIIHSDGRPSHELDYGRELTPQLFRKIMEQGSDSLISTLFPGGRVDLMTAITACEGLDGALRQVGIRILQQEFDTDGANLIIAKEAADGRWGRTFKVSANPHLLIASQTQDGLDVGVFDHRANHDGNVHSAVTNALLTDHDGIDPRNTMQPMSETRAAARDLATIFASISRAAEEGF